MEKKTIEQLEKEVADLKLENKELAGENALLDALNKDLTLEIEELKAGSEITVPDGFISKESFEVDGTTWGFVIPGINHNSKVVTPEIVMADKRLQKELVKIKSGMLREKP